MSTSQSDRTLIATSAIAVSVYAVAAHFSVGLGDGLKIFGVSALLAAFFGYLAYEASLGAGIGCLSFVMIGLLVNVTDRVVADSGAARPAFIIATVLITGITGLVLGAQENRARKQLSISNRGSLPSPRLCPYCKERIQQSALRCPHCTSALAG